MLRIRQGSVSCMASAIDDVEGRNLSEFDATSAPRCTHKRRFDLSVCLPFASFNKSMESELKFKTTLYMLYQLGNNWEISQYFESAKVKIESRLISVSLGRKKVKITLGSKALPCMTLHGCLCLRKALA